MVGSLKVAVMQQRGELFISLLLWALALSLFAVFFTYSVDDPGWNNGNAVADPNNIGGVIGAYVADVGFYAFGYFVLFIPICIAQFGWNYLKRWTRHGNNQILLSILFFIGVIVAMISGCGLEYLYFSNPVAPNYYSGGILGYVITGKAAMYLGHDQNLIALSFIAMLVLGTAAVGLLPLHRVLDITGYWFLTACRFMFIPKSFRMNRNIQQTAEVEKKKTRARKPEKKMPSVTKVPPVLRTKSDDDAPQSTTKRRTDSPPKRGKERVEPLIVPIESDILTDVKRTKQPIVPARDNGEPSELPKSTEAKPPKADDTQPESQPPAFPETSLLDPSNRYKDAYSEEEINHMGGKIEAMLLDFNVEVKVRKAHPGPVITQFEVEPAAGTKASQIVSLSTDLARTLTVQSVRVVDNIPGSSYIGIEVPNKKRETVRLIDGLESDDYKKSDHPLTLILGKDIRGRTVISNLAAMPHLLIAGTTGAGKSVCLNAILLSFLFKSNPDSMRLIMVDPKMLEFSVYEGIPHLLAPVITDMNKTENALRWCIGEMERRFRLMAQLGVRNLDNLNDTIRKSNTPIPDPFANDPEQPLETLPYIVFVIDELSDLIMVMGKKAEELIIRIAQRARAAGIHLIVATQRPSTDVIRGVLKANIPTRIGFKVASNADSRTILDQTGAENLLGAGDMLFLPPGSAALMRVHGAFVSDDEVKRVVDSIKHANDPDYDDSVTSSPDNDAGTGSFGGATVTQGEDDELYNSAVDFVIRSRRPTISSVQRHLRIGYNRAARIIETMEESGVISAVQAGGKREVLVPPPGD